MQLAILEAPPQDRFRIWYKEPFEMLERMNMGNGAIIALMMSLPLYERVYRHKVSTKEIIDNRPLWVKNDLKLKTEAEAQIFWNVFRDGLCHTGSFFEESERAGIAHGGADYILDRIAENLEVFCNEFLKANPPR